jgi:hypothetical protein
MRHRPGLYRRAAFEAADGSGGPRGANFLPNMRPQTRMCWPPARAAVARPGAGQVRAQRVTESERGTVELPALLGAYESPGCYSGGWAFAQRDPRGAAQRTGCPVISAIVS